MRLCEYVGIPSQFQGRVDGVGKIADGDVTFEKELSLTEIVNRIKVPNPNTGIAGPRIKVPNPNTGVAGPDPDIMDVLKQRELESQKAVKDAQSWRSNTPIASWTSANASGVARTINVYGYNKEIGYVWLAEGPSSSAANSQLFPEFVLAAKFPEWVAAKASLGKSSALPLLLGAAYLLLA